MFPTQIHPALAQALAARGYSTLTPVQLAVLEPQASDRDLLVSAKTGSGKTVAYGLVLIWAFAGILIRQTSSADLAGRYPAIIAAVLVALAVYLIAEVLIVRRRRIGTATGIR